MIELDTPVLTFEAEAHTYKLDGEVIPSVTQLISIMGEEIPDTDDLMDAALANASERGTTMHAYLAWRLGGGAAEDFEGLPQAYAGYADAVDLFLSEHEFMPYALETPMYARERGVTYAGTPDYIGMFDGRDTILDYKFVAAVDKSRVSAQLNGYMSLTLQNGFEPEKLFAVQFLKTGDYRLYHVADNADPWFLCLDVERTKNRKHPKGAIV